MRYILLFLMLTFMNTSFGQKKNSFSLKGIWFELDGRYRFKEYQGEAPLLRDFSVNYYRAIGTSGNWLLGAGLGYRKGYVNEFNPDSLIMENSIYTIPTANMVIRYEEWLGRSNKFVVELGMSINQGGKIKTINSFGNQGHPNRLKNSQFLYSTIGYQVKLRDNLKILGGIAGLYGLNPSLILNQREVKLSSTTFFTELRYNF